MEDSDNVLETGLEEFLSHESNFLVFSINPAEDFFPFKLKVVVLDAVCGK